MSLTSPQKRLLSQLSENVPDLENIIGLLKQQGITAVTDADGKVYLKLGAVNPDELRRLADALEKLEVTQFRGVFGYRNPKRGDLNVGQLGPGKK